jgi:hypothetical protein
LMRRPRRAWRMTHLLYRAAAGKVAALSPESPAWLATKST